MAEKVFIHDDDTATFVCPSCQKKRTIDASPYKFMDRSIMIKRKCSCGYVHVVLLERRRFIRKSVELPGSYIVENGCMKMPMTVKDLSRSGLKIELKEIEEVDAGDTLYIEFRLDDPHRTLIKKTVVVRTIMGLTLGVEFTPNDPANPYEKLYDTAIGYYTFK
jgi:hypothetical protein